MVCDATVSVYRHGVKADGRLLKTVGYLG